MSASTVKSSSCESEILGEMSCESESHGTSSRSTIESKEPSTFYDTYENSEGSITLCVDGFGLYKNPTTKKTEVVKRFTWKNANRMTVQVITYGATIVSMIVPDKYGKSEDVVMGFDDMDGYTAKNNPYFGATVGRVANRIAKGKFCLNSQKYELNLNNTGKIHLHGGLVGYDKMNWIPYVNGTTVVMTHVSEDGWENYPGAVMNKVTYKLRHDNSFHVSFSSISSKPTPINLTNHSYFNLAGHGSGHEEIYKHIVTINADKYTVTDSDSIPTGEMKCVGGTPYDLRIPHELGPAMARAPTGGFDDNFCITKGTEQVLTFVARAIHPKSGRVLEVYSDQPGVQFYTSNFLPNPSGNIYPSEVYSQDFYEMPGVTKLEAVESDDNKSEKTKSSTSESKSVTSSGKSKSDIYSETSEKTIEIKSSSDKIFPVAGKGGALYTKNGAFCLETQNFPDAINQPKFPKSVLNPDGVYRHEVIYKFGIHNKSETAEPQIEMELLK